MFFIRTERRGSVLKNGPPQAQFGAAAKAQFPQVFSREEVEDVAQHVLLPSENVHVVIVQPVWFEPADKRRVLSRLFFSMKKNQNKTHQTSCSDFRFRTTSLISGNLKRLVHKCKRRSNSNSSRSYDLTLGVLIRKSRVRDHKININRSTAGANIHTLQTHRRHSTIKDDKATQIWSNIRHIHASNIRESKRPTLTTPFLTPCN